MQPLYDLTMLLSGGLTAIVVTIFVIAMTFLGRAIEQARQEEVEKAEEARRTKEKEVAKLRHQLTALERQEWTQKGIRDLQKQVAKADKELSRASKQISAIRRWPALLTLREAVILPGVDFLSAAALSGIARALTRTEVTNFIHIIIWIVGLLALTDGIRRILRAMQVVQRVAITTEASLFQKQTEALTKALEIFEERRRPVVEVVVLNVPLRVKVGAEFEVPFSAEITLGEVARNVRIAFYVPPGFSVRQLPTRTQRPEFNYPSYEAAIPVTAAMYLKGTRYLGELKLKAPNQPGEYLLAYRIQCENFVGKYGEFNVTVEESPEDIEQAETR